MEIEDVDVEDLVPDPNNARRGSVGEMMKSLAEFGQHRPLVAQRGTGKVIVGNHMLEAAKALGWRTISVHWVDDDDKTAIRRGLADNLSGDRATWDDVQLASILAELGDDAKDLPGMTQGQLDRLLADTVTDVKPDPELPITPHPGEGYSYVVIMSQNDIDAVWLENVMGLRREKSWKSERVGLSRMITVQQLKQALNKAITRGEPFQ